MSRSDTRAITLAMAMGWWTGIGAAKGKLEQLKMDASVFSFRVRMEIQTRNILYYFPQHKIGFLNYLQLRSRK